MKIPPPAFRVFEKISATCGRQELILPQSLIVAGVSGGVDSMLLLSFLQYYQQKTAFDLLACHLNHGIRKGEADLDEALVKAYCDQYSIPFVPVREDVPAFAKGSGLGLEEAGRMVRRQVFDRVAAGYEEKKAFRGGSRIALAHHLDDRAESILMHMGRGAGLRGLIGIRYLDGPLIRPLLDIRRDELVEAARALGLPWREDASNLSDAFLRNRIRLELMPAWEKTLGYDPAPLLVRLGALAEKDDDALTSLAADHFRQLRLPDGSLSLTGLAALPEALASRVLQQYCGWSQNRESGPQPLSLAQIEVLTGLVASVTSGGKKEARLSLAGGITALMRDGRLWLEDKA
ncbi:MAG: tRNA lysidine(34) synthetase TilS [Clostridiaceae bacterium]|nr:tRNA lysidine(34) synthetase TilS [Clostridiaceae bacterium]